ncbi:hypothetical protein [Microbacterium sp.]|jgi:hypothetical protein
MIIILSGNQTLHETRGDSPGGHVYIDKPPPAIHFVPNTDPPPF